MLQANNVQFTAIQEQTSGFWVRTDSDAFKLNEHDGTVRIQVFRTGKFSHPVFGEIELNAKKYGEFALNFANGVPMSELDIDYDHKTDSSKGNKAAGWVRDVDFDDNGLYYTVELTDEAKAHIKNKEFRYFSADFSNTWQNPETETKYNNVLHGGALTNRPFLKGMMPINLSEVIDYERKESEMDEKLKKALIAKLELADDATDEQVMAALEADPDDDDSEVVKETEKETETKETEKTTEVEEGKVPAMLSTHYSTEEIKLAEGNPLMLKLMEDNVKHQLSLKLSDVAIKLSDESMAVVPPAVKKQAQEIMLNSSNEVNNKIVKLLTQFAKTGPVTLTEVGKTDVNGIAQTVKTNDGGDPAVKLNEYVEAKMKDDKELSYSEALDIVLSDNRDAFEAWASSPAN